MTDTARPKIECGDLTFLRVGWWHYDENRCNHFKNEQFCTNSGGEWKPVYTLHERACSTSLAASWGRGSGRVTDVTDMGDATEGTIMPTMEQIEEMVRDGLFQPGRWIHPSVSDDDEQDDDDRNGPDTAAPTGGVS